MIVYVLLSSQAYIYDPEKFNMVEVMWGAEHVGMVPSGNREVLKESLLWRNCYFHESDHTDNTNLSQVDMFATYCHIPNGFDIMGTVNILIIKFCIYYLARHLQNITAHLIMTPPEHFRLAVFRKRPMGLYSLSSKTSYGKI